MKILDWLFGKKKEKTKIKEDVQVVLNKGGKKCRIK